MPHDPAILWHVAVVARTIREFLRAISVDASPRGASLPLSLPSFSRRMRAFVTQVRLSLTSGRACLTRVRIAVTEVAAAPPRYRSPAPK
jgi:hypothetical protein